MTSKKCVVVLYGGQSVEHEVSRRSAMFVFDNLSRTSYKPHAVGIDKNGVWHPQNPEGWPSTREDGLPMVTTQREDVGRRKSPPASPFQAFLELAGLEPELRRDDLVVFPVIHGTGGEDGSLQGFLDLAQVPYVGPDTLSAAVGMDKVVAKELVKSMGVPIVPYVAINHCDWQSAKAQELERVTKTLDLPVFVKPAALGSSVGVTKVKSWGDLEKACSLAFTLDTKILVERGLNVREIECAVLGFPDVAVTSPGEVELHAEFYDYSAKYQDAKAATISIPAKLTDQQKSDAMRLAVLSCKALGLTGIGRVDLFLDKNTGYFYFNEVNTIPGFTSVSQFPLLWRHEGVNATELLDRAVGAAITRYQSRQKITRSFN